MNAPFLIAHQLRLTTFFLLVATMPVVAKSGRTWYSKAKLDTARSNLEKYEWARRARRAVLEQADRWAAYDDACLRALVVPPQVPRCYDIHNLGCPVHGTDANKGGLYKWGIDFDRPFKITCPAGGEEYPSNDFAAFLASGMEDRTLLTGPYADDGWGWHREREKAGYWFVAYYAHWSMLRFLVPAIDVLGEAAVLADEPGQARKYAHKCGVLLWQLAVHYPEYQYEKQSREAREHNPSYTGRITNMIWEVGPPATCARAYDAIWPYLRDDEGLQALAGLSGEGLDAFIRERILLTAARDITSANGRNRGNYGMHQQTLVTLAVALDEREQSPTSAEMINWVLANPSPRVNADMGLYDALDNLVHRDGMPQESPAYNYGWVNKLTQVAEALLSSGVNLFENRRFQRLLTWHYDLTLAGKFIPPLGDTGNMFARSSPMKAPVCRAALPWLKDPRLAADLRRHSGGIRDLYRVPDEELLAGYPQEAPEAAEPTSHHFPAYGLALLRSGAADSTTALALHYGSWRHHMHHDQLNLLLFAHDNALLCDVGYPEQTDAFNERRTGIWNNTIAHNTVTVDARKQGRGLGKLHAYEPNGFAKVADASCHPYAQCTLYRRASMVVEVAPGQSYVFDVFYVRGGSQHDFACMGTQGDFICDPELGPVQAEGSLAGPDVPYAQFYDDPKLKDKPFGSVSFGGYTGSGFQYLRNVQRAPLRRHAVAEWKLTKPLPGQPRRPWEGIGLRAHLVGTDEEVIAADCQPQRYKYLPPWVKHLIRRRTGEDLSSTFVTVFEPYRGSTWIETVKSAKLEPSDDDAVAVVVTLGNGERHYCFHSLRPERKYVVDGELTVAGQTACLVLGQNGTPQCAMLLNGRELAYGRLRLEGRGQRRSRVVQVDYANGTIDLADAIVGSDLLQGQTVLVEPEGFCASVIVREVLSPTRLSIGDEDLRVGGGPVTQIVPETNRLITSVASPHAQPGMTVLNGRLQVQGKLVEGDRWTLDRADLPRLKPSDFPTDERGLGPRFSVAMVGPGDEVVLPSLVSYVAGR